MLLLLEDDSRRITRITAEFARIAPSAQVMIWSNAHALIRESAVWLPDATLISLDHDLEALPGAEDPGDGLDAARFLVAQPVVRPVIIHSSNEDRAQRMLGEFELAGWPCARVLPFGEDWVESRWRQVAELQLGRSV